MSHTPGPWKWWTSNSYRRLTAEGKQDGGVLSAVSKSGHADVCVSEADAQLIAAAPDLLAALLVMTRAYVDLVNTGDAGRWNPEGDQEVREARAAIAKATGESA